MSRLICSVTAADASFKTTDRNYHKGRFTVCKIFQMVRQWMQNMGCERIFEVNNVTREGIPELMEYLKEDLPKLTLEQAKFKQSLGLNEWQPLPEGVEYPESIR